MILLKWHDLHSDIALKITFHFLKDFIYLRERGRECRSSGGRGRGRSRLPTEKGARCWARSQEPEIMT